MKKIEIREVEIQDVLRARDARAALQHALTARHGCPVISFSMNIAGKIKCDSDIVRAFREGVRRIEVQLALRGAKVLETHQDVAFTGCEQQWAVSAPAGQLKQWMCAIEDADALGRLFDIDVIGTDGLKLARPAQHERRCLICGEPAFACARSRRHTVEELFARTHDIIAGHFRARSFDKIAACAERALLYEVMTTPKPGLVDLANSGAHSDMDRFTFIDSACALRAYFRSCAATGFELRCAPADAAFAQLRSAGLNAEADMAAATGGINTHKGALFSLGILCAAAGSGIGAGYDLQAMLDRAARLGQPALSDLTRNNLASTGGERQYLSHGYTGVRGEVASGFASVQAYALPAFRSALNQGKDINTAGLAALAALMAHVLDSNVIRRAGLEAQLHMMQQVSGLNSPDPEALSALDQQFIADNISPGGCADLLAVVYFIYLLEREQDEIFA